MSCPQHIWIGDTRSERLSNTEGRGREQCPSQEAGCEGSKAKSLKRRRCLYHITQPNRKRLNTVYNIGMQMCHIDYRKLHTGA